jgi:DNA invertase Pin-like site-specific DNA recombinase
MLIPAAQYLRMSTEHQKYSLANQADAIREYADANSFEIVSTYEDAGRSGLRFSNRSGLKALLHDVLTNARHYRAILVYDISRWGRFQDTDEARRCEKVGCFRDPLRELRTW